MEKAMSRNRYSSPTGRTDQKAPGLFRTDHLQILDLKGFNFCFPPGLNTGIHLPEKDLQQDQ